ncbi:MAG: response regulator [Deltaproteobacteria bacterium]|nr:response regulator [Deltaproteobacteria bacterium]
MSFIKDDNNRETLYIPGTARNAIHRSIFIIDDEEPVRKVLNTHLVKEGYNVIQSRGGKGIFELLRASPFDILICDIRMPEVDGINILEFVRENFGASPVIMLTGLTDAAVAVDAMKKGAFDYIMKPVKKDDLMASIQKALMHRDLLVRNRQLELENRDYQMSLVQKVEERTKELNAKTMELESAYALLKTMNIQFINVLAETIEAKDLHTRGHCNRMRFLCVELGRLLNLSTADLEILEVASLLHDLGKVSVNEAVLNKPGLLTDEERRHMQGHAETGGKILSGIPLMEMVAGIIAAHHENFDGSGYPAGLKGEGIPLHSRIIAVADMCDAMASDRPYRKGRPPEAILEELKRAAGTQLDPHIARLFIENKLYLYKDPR